MIITTTSQFERDFTQTHLYLTRTGSHSDLFK